MSVYFRERTSNGRFSRNIGAECSATSIPSEFKRKLVDETCKPGASVSAIVLANGLNTNQLFAWRRQYLPNTAKPALVSVNLLDTPVPATNDRGHIDVRLRHGEVRVEGAVRADTLRVVLASLR